VEQRKARRFELKLPLQLIRSGAEALSEHGETRNLSSVGVLFQSDASLRIGDAVEYMITLPASAGEPDGVRLRCLGKVVRYGKAAEIAATLERYEFVRLTKN
jgi:PilZ domain-containing protein